jgi:ABC-type phosphate/phosphonate transport system substrate-binding protein
MTGALPDITRTRAPGPAPKVAGLPMYVGNKAGVEALWRQIAARLRDRGLGNIPDLPAWPDDYLAHWREPALLLSQACGYPLVTALPGQVRVVGAFRYNVPGCAGVLCRSQLVVRTQDPTATLADFRGRRVAYNGTDSQSGYNSLRALIAPMARDGRFFASHLETGGHLKSVLAVQGGLADIASIDCVSLAEFRRHTPHATGGVRVLGETAAYPGLPLVTAASTDDATLAALRDLIAQAVRDPELASLWHDLFVTGFEPLDEAAYRTCSAMQDGALALGYPAL